MNLFQLTLRNMYGQGYRSWTVVFCTLLLAGFALLIMMIMLGSGSSLRLAIERLGADIVVVPEGSATKLETALLIGNPAQVWMPAAYLAKIAAVPGVQIASPQVYLTSLSNASCCTVRDLFMIVYDPKTDFIIKAWLQKAIGIDSLRPGDAIGGDNVFIPERDRDIQLYGCHINLRAKLAATGTGLDHTLFLPMETAHEMARISLTEAVTPLKIPAKMISAVMVRLKPDAIPDVVAAEIMDRVPGVTSITTPGMFQSQQKHLYGILGGVALVLLVTALCSEFLMGLVFSMAANERRRELGVLRALGASKGFIFRALLLEAVLLAIGGGFAGTGLAILVLALFRRLLILVIGFPFVLPSPAVLLLLVLAGVGGSVLSVALATALPAYRVSRQDPSMAMRE